jgi:hypothetical protein
LRSIGFRVSSTRWFTAVGFIAALAIGIIVAATPAEARDRPGTPNQEVLYICDYPAPTFAPRLCGQFNNTASEVVRIETDATRNGQPYPWDPNTFGCANLTTKRVYKTDPGGNLVPTGYFRPEGEICFTPRQTYGRKKGDPDFPYVFSTPTVAWNTQYCIRFRARTVSDSIVSEKWSNYACENVPPQPRVPDRPEFSVAFSGQQTYGNLPTGPVKPGETAQVNVIPAKLTVTTGSNAQRAVIYRLTLNGQPQEWKAELGATVAHTFDLPGAPSAAVQLCAVNFSGQTCTSKTINVLAQGVQMQTPPPRLNPGIVGTRTPGPAYIPAKPNRVIGLGVPTRQPISQAQPNQTYMAGTDMPGNDYNSKPISGTAIDCENMCNADGKCLSWTWVKPGVQNAQAMCWLKNAVPPTRPNPNTISGIKAGSTGVH